MVEKVDSDEPADQALEPDDSSENEIVDEDAFLPWDQEVYQSDEEFEIPIGDFFI